MYDFIMFIVTILGLFLLLVFKVIEFISFNRKDKNYE